MADDTYSRMARAIAYLRDNRERNPTLSEVAGHIGMSRFHFQRTFTAWAGVGPKRFLQALNVERAKLAMSGSGSLLDATFETGLSSLGRLHDLFVTIEAMTPGEHRAGGAGLDIAYGFHETPSGQGLICSTPRGICGLSFVDSEPGDALGEARDRFPNARFFTSPEETRGMMFRIFDAPFDDSSRRLRVLVGGTNFHVQVWRALLSIPPGAAVGYGDVARRIGRPGSARAVGGAVARNAVAFLIPCHRVVRESGAIGGYRWGSERKSAMQSWEAVRASH